MLHFAFLGSFLKHFKAFKILLVHFYLTEKEKIIIFVQQKKTTFEYCGSDQIIFQINSKLKIYNKDN